MKNSQITFGIGRACTNPDMPVSLAGYFNVRMWDRILDDLEVRVLVMEKGGQRVALINMIDNDSNNHVRLQPEVIQQEFYRFSRRQYDHMRNYSYAPEVRLSNPGFLKEYYLLAAKQTSGIEAGFGQYAGRHTVGHARPRLPLHFQPALLRKTARL